MRESRHRRTRRPSGLLTSLVPLALVPVLLVVPASLPLCAMEIDLCSVDAPPVPEGAHCPMEATGLGDMPCCVQESAPQPPVPATPAKADADLRVQVKAPAPSVTHAAFLAAPVGAAPPHLSAAAPAAPAVPLYTLLSTLLS